MTRHFLKITDWSTEELQEALTLAGRLKQEVKADKFVHHLANRSYAQIFYKNSLRTRTSFEVGLHQLGAQAIHLTEQDFSLGKREAVADVARVLSRYVHGVLIRTFVHQDLEELKTYSDIPIVNMLTDWTHPCQIMADALTLVDHFGKLDNLKIVYLGDGNNITNSWINLSMRFPINLHIATSPDSLPDMELVKQAQEQGLSQVHICHDPREAAADADVLYTDVWASMGQKDLAELKTEQLKSFQVNQDLLALARPHAVVMHCLPAERGREITHDVIEGPQSVVWDQAENRLHIQKAILVMLEQWRSQSLTS